MIIFKTTAGLTAFIEKLPSSSGSIGFVPTMGALQKGHIFLVEQSKKQNDITICSIFVNPTQFNNATDLEKYPITLESDIDMLERAGCDALFLPTVKDIYSPNSKKLHY